MVDLECKMKEIMAQKINDALLKRNDGRRYMVLDKDPFTPGIMAVLLPKGFKQPMIEVYGRVTEPLDHIHAFVDVALDAMMCQSFPPTLRRDARD